MVKIITEAKEHLVSAQGILRSTRESVEGELRKWQYLFKRSKRKQLVAFLDKTERMDHVIKSGIDLAKDCENPRELLPSLYVAYEIYTSCQFCSPMRKLLFAPRLKELIEKINRKEEEEIK